MFLLFLYLPEDYVWHIGMENEKNPIEMWRPQFIKSSGKTAYKVITTLATCWMYGMKKMQSCQLNFLFFFC